MMKRILLVEDDTTQVFLMAQLFKKSLPNAELFSVGTFEQAFDFLEETDIDLVILGVLLHGNNSLKHARKIAYGSCHPCVVVLTGVDDAETQHQAMMAGVDALVSKEVSNDHLVTLIKTLLVNYS
jgi:DNA-binding NarL/FixJ family response regulator